MLIPLSFGMDCCGFSSSDINHLGEFTHRDTGTRCDWISYNNGRFGFFTLILFNNALVENTMAKLKYVHFLPPFSAFPFLIYFLVHITINN